MFKFIGNMAGLWHRLVSVFAHLAANVSRDISIGRQVRFRGFPLIQVSRGAKISIGDGVTLNSLNRGYHLNMFAPVKILADRPGARIIIGEMTRIHGSCLHAYKSITIGKRCLIAANCQIMDSNGHRLSFEDVGGRISSTDEGRGIVIEDDVWLGAGAVVLPGVKIGRGTVIGAGSVVTADIPSMVVAAGNPARVVRGFDVAHREQMGRGAGALVPAEELLKEFEVPG